MAANQAQELGRAPNRWQDRTGKWLFSIFAAIGLAVIIWIEISQVTKVLSMSICVALLIGYTLMTYWIPSMRARADQIGDNVYYLGLLYTLMSLAAAIVRLSNDPNAAEAILRNFGIALVTTIAGLMLRVMISQMRDDPVDIERETRESLLESTRRFRTELQQSTDELWQFQVSLKQQVDESVSTTLATSTKMVEEISETFEKASKALADTVDNHLTSVTDHGDKLEQARQKFAESLEDVAGRMASIDIDDQTFVQPISSAMNSLQTAMTDHADKLEAQSARLNGAIEGTEKLGDQAARFDEASAALNSAAQDLQATGTATAELQTAINEIMRNMASFAETVQNADSSVSTFSTRSSEALASTLDAMDKRQNVSMEAFSSNVETLKSKLEKFDQVSNKFMDSGGKFADRMSESEETLVTVKAQLADLAEYIIKRLERA